jgi:FkbM family methyltransferase
MTMPLRSQLQRVFRALGYDVRRYHPSSSEAARLSMMLKFRQINLYLDVGANVGQAVYYLRNNLNYGGRIVSFEPMKAAYASLAKAARNDPLWEIAPRCALGSENGEVIINISSNSVSSSILPMLDAHGQAAPESRYEAIETVPLKTLDTAASHYVTPDSRTFLKIDTQGYERRVLDGAHNILKGIDGVSLELSLIPLYAGQQLMPEMLDYMREIGFGLWGANPAFVDSRSGRTLQLDAIFFRDG